MFNVAAITRPLLLLHPIGQDAGCWRWLKPEHGVTPVYPGHGGRPRRPGMTLDELADEAIASVDGPVDLLGVAMGGIVAQHLLLRHPDRVRSALIACAGGRTRPEVQLARAEACETQGMEAVLGATLDRWFTPAAAAQPGHPGLAYARSTLLAMDPAAMADSWRALASHDVYASIGEVQVPVTLVAGRDDAAVPPAAVAELHSRLPGSRLVVLPGPHMVHLEEGRRLREALRDHLAWVGNRAAIG